MMARKLPLFVGMKLFLAAIALGGCFFQRIDDSSTPIEGENLAPTIDPEVVLPGFDTFPSVLMAQPESISFNLLTVEDPNIDDTLTVRFYADGSPDFIIGSEHILSPSGEVVRPGVIGFVLSGDKLTPFQDENGNLVGNHRLEVLISDRGFVSDSGAGARQVPADGRVSYFYWELEF